MSRTLSPSANRPYGISRVCRVWKRPRGSFLRRRQREVAGCPPARRRGPQGACSDADLLAHIRDAIDGSHFSGEGYRKIHARLRMRGVRTSQRRVRRIIAENGLQAPHRRRTRPERSHNGTIVTDRVDTVWGTDMTETMTGEGRVHLFFVVDHCSTEILGFHVDRRPNRWAALEPVRQAVARRFGGLEAGSAEDLVLRHDNGSNYAATDFQREIRFLGIESSPSFVRQPQGNDVAERLIRTVKEQILWIRNFDTIEELTRELGEFVERYNAGWLCQRHGHRTPSQIGAEQRALDRHAAIKIKEAA